MNSSPALLDLRHVTVFRGQADAAEQEAARPALEDISLRIEAGEHVSILGPNGCGKSTLIKTITRECYPLAHEGSSISILGRERWNIFELRSLLGIVSPDLLGACSTEATGRDVVLSGFFSSTRIFPHHHPDPRQLALAERALERMGVLHLANRAVAHMSSGEAKRTLIARALVHDPRALLVRRAEQRAGYRRAAAIARSHAHASAIGDCNFAGDPSCIRNYSGNSAGDFIA